MERLQDLLAIRRNQAVASVIAFIVLAGAAGLVYTLAGGDHPEPRAEEIPTPTPTVVPTPLPTPSPTPSPTPEPTPEPTPPPYDGAVVRLSMPRLGINHYIERVAVIGGQMQTPSDGIYAIGWYYDYPKPGWSENAVFLPMRRGI